MNPSAAMGMGTTCLKMRGIPFGCTEQEITRFFSDARVTPLRMHRKANGGEVRGVACVAMTGCVFS